MRHHTKDKGDKGVGFVIADLLKNNIQVALPISEHLPFDCIAISETGELRRLQIKHRKISKHGTILVELGGSWSDTKGIHKKPLDLKQVDVIAVYCPDTSRCYYINSSEITTSTTLTLRVTHPKNGQIKSVIWAARYEGPERIF